jgi:PhoH-like ATPase
MGRKIGHNKIQLVKKQYPWSLNPRNKEQVLAVDMLMDPNIDLITLIGIAGCGKSLIALACALEMVLNKKMYDRLIVYRPFEPVGNEIGFLPGSMEEKLLPWMGAVMDSFEVLFSNRDGDWRKNLEMYIKKHKIELEAMTFIRGRSIANSIILIDEAQNISQNDIKTLLTRAGQGSKIVLTGDISQIDTKNLDVTSNGLTYVIDCFQDTHLSGHITFTKGERSRLASMAAELL